MSFLDNLESSLNSLERNQERGGADDQQRRQDEKAWALASAPAAEALKSSPFPNELIGHAVRIAHGTRTKVHMLWAGTTLRLEARDRRLELRPTPEGVQAVFVESGEDRESFPLDLESDPEKLAKRWLETLQPV